MIRTVLILCIALLLLAACGGNDNNAPECYSQYEDCASDAAVIATAAAYPVKTQPGPRSVVTPNWPPGK